MTARLLALALVLAPLPALAELRLPAGFTTQLYVTGEGFDTDTARGVRGIPSTSTLAFDHAGALYLARSGRRYFGGEVYDLWPIYRIPAGGAHLTPDTEARFFHGPPLPNPQVAAARGGRELLVTTFDRERKVGALYRLIDGRAELLAGGTPEPGRRPVFKQPEGIAVDAAGNVYVADRDQGVVVRLQPDGRASDPPQLLVTRPRLVAVDQKNQLWVGADGSAEVPIQQGPGEIVRVDSQRGPAVIFRGPVVAAIGFSPANDLFVASRQERKIFVLTPDGKQIEFANFTDGDTPRSLCFAPVTPETKRLGMAGDLFVVTIKGGAWPVNEIVRITGPFEGLVPPR